MEVRELLNKIDKFCRAMCAKVGIGSMFLSYLKLGILLPFTKFVTDFAEITDAERDNCFVSFSKPDTGELSYLSRRKQIILIENVCQQPLAAWTITTSLGSVHLFFTSPMRSNSLSDLENIFDSINDLKLAIFTLRFRSLFERRSMVPVTFSIRCTFDSELSLWSTFTVIY